MTRSKKKKTFEKLTKIKIRHAQKALCHIIYRIRIRCCYHKKKSLSYTKFPLLFSVLENSQFSFFTSHHRHPFHIHNPPPLSRMCEIKKTRKWKWSITHTCSLLRWKSYSDYRLTSQAFRCSFHMRSSSFILQLKTINECEIWKFSKFEEFSHLITHSDGGESFEIFTKARHHRIW